MTTLSDRRFTVRYTRDEDGYWSSEVLEQPGCRSFGRSLSEAQRRTGQALAGWLEAFEGLEVPDPTALSLIDEFAVDLADEQIDLVSLRQQRHDLEQLRTQVTKDTTLAAAALLRQHMTVRDVATALGISPARVQQLAVPRTARRRHSGSAPAA